MDDQQTMVQWRDGSVPVSTQFDDPYFSLDDGLAETRHVFVAGNGLPGRFKPDFHIAELGFGTGLNMLTTWQAFRQSGVGGKLIFTSFEAFPLSAEDMAKALAVFPELQGQDLLKAWAQGDFHLDLDDLQLRVIHGDARQTLPSWDDRADAWFLDGFSPAKNPEMWGDDLMAEVGRHTKPGGTFATYTAAGYIRRALQSAGFDVTRSPGFGRKRHMSCGVRR